MVGKENLKWPRKKDKLHNSYRGTAMKFTAMERDSVVVLTLDGEMVGGPDATLLTEKLRDLIKNNKNKIVVDLKRVNYMNSSGLGILIAGLTTVRNSGGDLKLLHLEKRLLDLIKITKMDRVFSLFEDEDKAVDSFVK